MDELAMPGHKVNSTDTTRPYATWEDMFKSIDKVQQHGPDSIADTLKAKGQEANNITMLLIMPKLMGEYVHVPACFSIQSKRCELPLLQVMCLEFVAIRRSS